MSLRDRVIRLNGARWKTFRTAAAIIEPLGHVTHGFGAVDGWHLLRALGRRPMIFTVALPGPALQASMYDKVTVFAAESECLADDLSRAGVAPERIRVIYPGVNLNEYRPLSRTKRDRFRLLFASAPSDAGEFDARGIPVLVELARLCPEIDVTLLWRWGHQDAAQRAFANLQPPPNIRIDTRVVQDMTAAYHDADAIACLYAPGFGKSCPNSVIEAMACGVPALVSATCGIGQLISRNGAGLATSRDPADVADAARTLVREHSRFAAGARRVAERHFDVRQFIESYTELYEGTAAAVPHDVPVRTPAGASR